MTTRLSIIAVLLAALGALIFRVPDLAMRPMHQDEAIHCYRFEVIRETGVYQYDPSDYHGPTLNYFTFPVVWLAGDPDLAHLQDWMFRIVPVLFGTALVLLLLLLRDGLGDVETFFAAVFTAVSPAMVFFSRYYIQEILLVFFVAVAIAAGWRFAVSRRWGWLVVLGASLGFMHATKETFILNVFAAVCAAPLMWLYTRLVDGEEAGLRPATSPRNWAIVLVTGAVVSVTLFSSFFHNWAGVKDSILTYAGYFTKGTGGKSDHDHPWGYYFQILFWFRYGRSLVTSEMVIGVLAVVGFVRALWPRGALAGAALRGVMLQRFLAIYTLVLTLVYCQINYKTPWCALGFLHGMILLAGLGAGAIVRVVRDVPGRVAIGALVLLGGVNLGLKAYELNFVRYADYRRNPYVYAHPTTTMMYLVDRIDAIARVWPHGIRTHIQFVTNDCWPVPWYLRRFHYMRFPTNETQWEDPEIIVANTNPDLNTLPLPKEIETQYKGDMYGLRPGTLLILYVRNDVWDRFMETRR